jgi:hypothetical protein
MRGVKGSRINREAMRRSKGKSKRVKARVVKLEGLEERGKEKWKDEDG